MADHLLDTNVLSKFFAGDQNVRQFLSGIDAAIITIVYIELIQGSIKKRERELIKRNLANLTYFTLTPQIAAEAIVLIDKYSSSQGLFLPDALIAATAVVNDLTLVTFNVKDFRFIKNLRVVQP
jgi:predicted nucleic acid-binding protein